MLIDKVTALGPAHTVLVTAATGGVGRLLCQAAQAAGARVIGSVSTPQKAESARDYGCAHALTYDQDNFLEEIRDLTQGNGVDIAYDSVGAKTFQNSLSALRVRGHLVNFGQSSGAVDPIVLSELAAKSLSVTRPILFHYISDPVEYRAMSAAAFSAFDAGTLVLPDLTAVDLADAAAAHRRLESGQGGGSLYLAP
ncbi:MAG: zinc-binding dehydrogenase [Thalassobaculaceae bacterium]